MSFQFTASLEVSDELELDPSNRDFLASQEKLRERLRGVRHPLGLREFLVPVGVRNWFVWKGTLTREKTHGMGGRRFFLQMVRTSSEHAVFIVRFRGPHDDYVRYHARVMKNEVSLIAPKATPSASTRKHPSGVLRLLTAPQINYRSVTGPSVTETLAVPTTFESHHVLNAASSGEQRSLQIDDTKLSIEPSGSNVHIRVDGKGEEIVRSYPLESVRSDEAWTIIRNESHTPDTDPCLELSEGEREILDGFQSRNSLPARIDGSAGSGKTTLLSQTLASLVAMKLKTEPFALESPLPIGYPLFLTYSDELCRKARVRLRNLLVVQHGVSRAVAERVAELVCTTVEHQVCKVLNISPPPSRRPTGANTKKTDEDETDWGHFRNWWSRTSGGAHSRGGLDPAEVYRVLRMFVFGYLPADRSATDEEKAEAQDRRQRRQKTHDVSEGLLASCFNIWAEYRQQLRRDVRTPFAERTEEAIRRLADEPEKHAIWSHILCDEVQDLTDIDLTFIIGLSRYSGLGFELNAAQSPRSLGVMLPLIVAGDEMQSVNPSGFTFEGLDEILEETSSFFGYEMCELQRRVVLGENFRSLPAIVELGTACRRLLEQARRRRDVQSVKVHRVRDGEGKLELLASTGDLPPTVANLFNSRATVVILPCTIEAKDDFCGRDGELRDIVGASLSVSERALMTPEECKGLEFPVVFLCGFGAEYVKSRNSKQLQWILNALSVAATRGRNRVVFIDRPDSFKVLEHDLLETGRLNRPFKQFNASELQAIEIDDKLETLCTRLSNSLKNRDDAEVLELLEELKEVARSASSNSAIDTRQAVAAALEWLRFSKSGSMPNWKLISGYNDGFLVRNILDDSFAQKNVSVLKSAVQNQAHLRNTATKRRLLRAACEVLVENVNSVAPAREGLDWIHALYELNFQALDELGDELWQRCSQAIVATRRPWDRQLAEEMLLYRPSFVEADPLWAHIDIRSCLDDLPEARRRLIKWEGKLDQSLFEALEEEIFLYEYGLGWLSTASRNLAMKVFRSRPFTEPALISALSEPPVVADTFRHLTELCGLISDVKLDEVRHLSKPKAINASALVALVASAVNASNEGLTRADEKLKTAMHPSGAEGVKL